LFLNLEDGQPIQNRDQERKLFLYVPTLVGSKLYTFKMVTLWTQSILAVQWIIDHFLAKIASYYTNWYCLLATGLNTSLSDMAWQRD
jgi:hypothetical protein